MVTHLSLNLGTVVMPETSHKNSDLSCCDNATDRSLLICSANCSAFVRLAYFPVTVWTLAFGRGNIGKSQRPKGNTAGICDLFQRNLVSHQP
jgi:hypothetical protein